MHKMASSGGVVPKERLHRPPPAYLWPIKPGWGSAYVKVHQIGEAPVLCEFAVTRVLNAPADRAEHFCAEINGGEKMGLR